MRINNNKKEKNLYCVLSKGDSETETLMKEMSVKESKFRRNSSAKRNAIRNEKKKTNMVSKLYSFVQGQRKPNKTSFLT